LIHIGIQAYWVTTVLASVYSLIRFIDKPDSKWSYLCGLFAGITFLFRQDSGIYLLIALIPLLIVVSRGSGLKRILPAIRSFGIFILIVGATIGYFAAHGVFSQMINSTLRFAVFKFPSARPLPYPIPWKQFFIVGDYSAPLMVAFLYQLFAFYLLPVILIMFSGLSIRNLLKRNKERDYLIVASILIIALMMILMVRVRPSGSRIMTSALLCAVACSIMMSNKNRAIRIASISTLAMTVLAFVPFAAYSVRAQRSFSTEIVNDRCGVLASKGYAQFLSVTASKIRELTLPSEKILCGNLALYFLSDRSSVTRYYEPHLYLTDTPEIQRSIIWISRRTICGISSALENGDGIIILQSNQDMSQKHSTNTLKRTIPSDMTTIYSRSTNATYRLNSLCSMSSDSTN
jgi:4-amino-4-deoxy-L-arabinose transferase-like glycosyltransferase